MPTVRDALEHAKFLIQKGRGDEPCKLILPRLEAQRRKENAEQQKRLIKVMMPEEYSEWNSEFDRYTEASGGNPIIARSIMLRLLKKLPDSSIAKLADDSGDEDFMLGRGRELAE